MKLHCIKVHLFYKILHLSYKCHTNKGLYALTASQKIQQSERASKRGVGAILKNYSFNS